MHQEIIIKVLSRVPIFKDISKEAITKLAYIARFNQYLEGSIVFKEGDPGDCLYIVASGRVEVFTRKDSGNEIKLNSLSVAEVFGEMALLDGLPRSATVKVSEKAILFYINRTDFNLFLMQNPDVALKIIETISRRLRDITIKLRDISDENESLRLSLQETYNPFGDNNSEEAGGEDQFLQEEYTCPCCDSPVRALKTINKYLKLIKTDNDFCQHYKTVNPLFYEIIICPGCGYAFSHDSLEKLSHGAKQIVREKIKKMSRPPSYGGPRSLDEAIECFQYAFQFHYDLKVNGFTKPDLSLKLAWLYRYKEDTENEKKHLLLALERFLAAYENGKYEDAENDIYMMYIIGQIHLKTGNPGEALKWLSRITQHPQKDRASNLVEKAREQWQEIKQEARKK